jgi:hypothetical protein
MTSVAIRKPADPRHFVAAILAALLFFALVFFAGRAALAPAALETIPLVPCKQCGQGCPCPRLAGSTMCGCPR